MLLHVYLIAMLEEEGRLLSGQLTRQSRYDPHSSISRHNRRWPTTVFSKATNNPLYLHGIDGDTAYIIRVVDPEIPEVPTLQEPLSS